MPKGIKKSTIIFLTAIFLAVDIFGLLAFAHPAKAQFVVTDPGSVAQRIGIKAAQDTTDLVEKVVSLTVLGSLTDMVSYFTRKLAYDTAVYVASGGKGQGALVFDQPFGEYIAGVAADSVGEAVESLGEPFGLNLCQIPDPRLNVQLQIGLRSIFPSGTEPKPKCSWQELSDSWGNIGEVLEKRYGPGGSRLSAEYFSANLKVNQSDFGVALGAIAQIDAIREQAILAKNLERQVGQGVKNVTSLISGKIETPAQQVKKELDGLSAAEQAKLTNVQIAGLYAKPLENMPIIAAKVFLNTLMSQVLQNIMTGLYRDDPSSGDKGGSGVFSFYADVLQDNKKTAQKALSYLLAPTIVQVNSYNIIEEFAACPDRPGLNNCVIDSSFKQAINRSLSGTPITIGEAIEEGLLQGSWPLISPRREVDNTSRSCYIDKYCYSNIQKLRRSRILPIGFELAALKSDTDQPWTLAQVVGGFNDCNAQGQSDASYPFCHLIDPNWIIKTSQARCQTKVYGPELINANTDIRRQECVDLQTCVLEDASGACASWGYCTREKNVWQLPGKSCPAEYNTCTTYRDTSTNEQLSYLAKTVDFGECTVQSVGCQAYSTEFDSVADDWVTANVIDPNFKSLGRNQMLYLNNKSETCSQSAEGCTGFYGAQRNPASGLFIENAGQYNRDSTNVINLKKAPDYLGCYDADTSSLSVEWPETQAEIAGLPGGRCDEFAQACTPSEVGCDQFTATDGSGTLPAIASAGNSCVSECIGYETFKQEASSFEGEEFPLYFIPSLGQSCSAANVGCDEFTNLEAQIAGGESLEYYSSVRYCEKPLGTNEKAFISWEGSDQEGYVLRNHNLKPVDSAEASYINSLGMAFVGGDTANSVFPAGSPAYNDNTLASLQDKYNRCNETSYNLLINNPFDPARASPDCRAFYDNAGNIFYRLMSDTVTISNQCQRLRKSESRLFVDTTISDQNTCSAQNGNWNGASCERCYAGGEYDNGACIYQALPSQSDQCSAVSVGCRAYTGNSGNNLNPRVVYDSFEGDPVQALANWSSGIVSVEAIQSSQHSLQLGSSQIIRTIPVGTINTDNSLIKNNWYELTFWSRGEPIILSIEFRQGGALQGSFTFDPARGSDTPISVGNNWREYRLGPVQFTGDGSSPVDLTFTVVRGSGIYFLDNVQLGQLEDKSFLIKDSWKVLDNQGRLVNAPPACFNSNQDPLGPLPGAALGCREYTDSKDNTYYLTGFASLCREEAVGCQPVWDSHNTLGEVGAKIYNAVCNGLVSGSACNLELDGEVLGSCIVPQGQSSCHVEEITLPANKFLADLDAANRGNNIDLSTIYILPETSEPIFLTNRDEFQCQATERGCMLAGQQDHINPGASASSFNYLNTYIINNPDNYGETLCRQDLIGCNEYSAGANSYYFKDPRETGNTICSYKTGINGASGWFKDGIGECGGISGNYCQSDNDCSPGITCDNIGAVACYENYIQTGNIYGIWSNESSLYAGFVGACPTEFNACTELIDPQDTSNANPDGKPYYSIFDNSLTSSIGECEGQVSLKEGCVLFDKTDQPNKIYDTIATYSASDATNPQYGLVDPRSSASNDANIILKVNRDRACSEWLACTSEIPHINEDGSKTRLCNQYKACDNTIPGQECTSFVSNSLENQFLDEVKYTSRDVSWYGADYTGHSLLNRYQITDYVYLNFPNDDKQYLAYKQNDVVFRQDPAFADAGCEAGTEEGDPCGFFGDGRCYQGQCVYPIDGSAFANYNAGIGDTAQVDAVRNAITAPACKGYPEEDSPYPFNVVKEVNDLTATVASGTTYPRTGFEELNSDFAGVNVCQDGNCSCQYDKNVYKDGTADYWTNPLDENAVAPGICLGGGDKDGKPCEVGLDCEDSADPTIKGICNLKSKKETHLGLKGFCLEPDLSHPINGRPKDSNAEQEYACLTWLPIQTSASSVDLFNRFTGAGYDPSLDAIDINNPNSAWGEVMCVSATNGLVYDQSMFAPADINFTLLFLDYFQPTAIVDYFAQDGYPRVSADNTCTGANLNGDNYIGAACGGESALYELDSTGLAATRRLYKAMQVWSWREIGTNATVLRVEGGNDNADNGGDGWPGRRGALFEGSAAESTYTYFFASHANQGRAYGSFEATALHPPRTWSQSTIADCTSFYYPFARNGREIMSTIGLSPEANLKIQVEPPSLGFCLEPKVYRAPQEADLLESGISKVYFLPIFYSQGFSNLWSPQMVQDNFYIDILSLQNQSNFKLPNNVSGITGNNTNLRFHAQTNSGSNALAVWNYVLRRGNNPAQNLVSYYDYGSLTSQLPFSPPTAGTLFDPAIMNNPRNEIHSRYVAVLAHSGGGGVLPSFFSGANVTPTSVATDPFSAACEPGLSWLAIGMDFNADGEFLGYISKSCMPSVNFAVAAELPNKCNEFAQVYNSDNEGSVNSTNKAWTQRTWINSLDPSNGTDPFHHPTSEYEPALWRDGVNRPFGSLQLSSDDISNIDDTNLRNYLFNSTIQGIPYSCASPSLQNVPIIEDCTALGKFGYASSLVNILSPRTKNEALLAIEQLFTLVFVDKEYNIITNQFNNTSSDVSDNIQATADSLSSVPKVFSLNPAECFSAGASGLSGGCSAGDADNMTVGTRNGTLKDYDGDGAPDEDANRDGQVDAIISQSSYTADLRFFAFADDNHMPIRRVSVDWSDGETTNQSAVGLYKNHKPLCSNVEAGEVMDACLGDSAGNLTPVNLPCQNDNNCPLELLGNRNQQICANASDIQSLTGIDDYSVPRFGNSPRACVARPFEYIHTYNCNAGNTNSQVSSLPSRTQVRLRALGLSNSDNVCVFRPKVQVVDNWGFCNGSCPGGLGGDACYSSTTLSSGGADECKLIGVQPGDTPWTEYKGTIIVIPSQD